MLCCCQRYMYANNVAIEPHIQQLNGEGFHHKYANRDDNSSLDQCTCQGFLESCMVRMNILTTLMLSKLPFHPTHMNQKESMGERV